MPGNNAVLPLLCTGFGKVEEYNARAGFQGAGHRCTQLTGRSKWFIFFVFCVRLFPRRCVTFRFLVMMMILMTMITAGSFPGDTKWLR